MKFIPNLFTLANLASGLLALLAVFDYDFQRAGLWLILALVLDVLDGLVARWLKVTSEVGKQLDSLADVVSFGVVPGLLLYQVLSNAVFHHGELPLAWSYLALAVPLFSALRLARFNVDERQTSYFIGLPTPANAVQIFLLVIWLEQYPQSEAAQVLGHPLVLGLFSLASAFLLVAPWPLLSLKAVPGKNWWGPGLLGAGSLIFILSLGLTGTLFIIPLYLILSLIFKPGSP